MESVEKLRNWANNYLRGGQSMEAFNALYDEIEREISERYMLLPVDADGVPIHMGDTVEGELFFDNATVKGTVTTYHIHDNDEPDTVYIKVDCGNGTWTIKELRIERCRHVKPRTLEDVLREYGKAYHAHMADNYMNYDGTDEQVIGKYADEIRDLFGGDAE